MKVVCEPCGTKYSIDDNRVAGKAFKIRCKKCSRDIIMRGAPAPVAETVPNAEPVPSAGVWHVVLGSTQVGPIELAELYRLRATGRLDDDSLIWREGFDDWRKVETVAEMRGVARSSVEVSPELAAGPEPARPALRSERNESSVLFTLGNLTKLAAAPSPASPSTGTEGSGLLDIRSLARSLVSIPIPAHAHAGDGSFEDLPVWAPVSFVEPMTLVPGSPRGRDRRLVWALAASIGMLAVVAAILVVIVVRDHATPVHAAVMPAGPATPTSAAPPRPGR